MSDLLLHPSFKLKELRACLRKRTIATFHKDDSRTDKTMQVKLAKVPGWSSFLELRILSAGGSSVVIGGLPVGMATLRILVIAELVIFEMGDPAELLQCATIMTH